MFGIMSGDGDRVICNRSGTKVFVLKRWDRAMMPAMRSSESEINDLLSLFGETFKRHDLTVFRFTEEQIEKILVKKLQGY